jgi:hypothetical protein
MLMTKEIKTTSVYTESIGVHATYAKMYSFINKEGYKYFFNKIQRNPIPNIVFSLLFSI